MGVLVCFSVLEFDWMKEAILYKRGKKSLTCTACQWYCKIPSDFVGVCSVRANIKGKLYLLTHSLGYVNLDPVEKKPFYHFLPGSGILSFGTYGCNFACDFCQNWQESQTPKIIKAQLLKTNQPKKVIQKISEFIKENSSYIPPAKLVKMCVAQKIPSIAFTYNEPTIFAEYAYETMKLAKKHKIYGVFVSSGFESKETLHLMEDYIDAYNIDLKGGSEKFYENISHTKLKPVLQTIEEIYKRKKWIEITTLLIPGINTNKKEIRFIAKFLSRIDKNIPWHVTAFYPQYKMLNVPPTDYETLKKAYEIGKEEGLKYVYTGNLAGVDTESTYCPKCQKLLIKRVGYKVVVEGLNLKTGLCKECGEKINGIWK